MTTVDSPDAGWYPDPENAAQLRWWNGSEWTDQVAPQIVNSPQERQNHSNPVGAIGFSLALVGTVLACFPSTMAFGWVLLITALILAIIGTALPGRTKGLSITGLVLSIVGTFIGFAAFTLFIGSTIPTDSSVGYSLQPDLEVPAGYEDTNTGVAIRWIDNPDCGYSTCAQLEAFALRACPNSLFIEANVLDTGGRIVGYTNDLASSVRAGETAIMTMRTFEDAGSVIDLTDISCY